MLKKNDLRSELKRRRRELRTRFGRTAPQSVSKHFFEKIPVQEGNVIAGYWPIMTELDVRPTLYQAQAEGYQTALPVMVGNNLDFCLWHDGDGLVKDPRFGVPEPEDKSRVVQPDIVLVPMLGFDPKGYRLGYGAGFYDRILAGLRKTKDIVAVGVTYAALKVDQLPTEPHDEPLDWVITEKGAEPYS